MLNKLAYHFLDDWMKGVVDKAPRRPEGKKKAHPTGAAPIISDDEGDIEDGQEENDGESEEEEEEEDERSDASDEDMEADEEDAANAADEADEADEADAADEADEADEAPRSQARELKRTAAIRSQSSEEEDDG